MTSAPRLALLASTVLTLALASIGCGGETSDTAPATGGSAGTTAGTAGTSSGTAGTAGTAAGTAGSAGSGATAGTSAGTAGSAAANAGTAGTAGATGGTAGVAGTAGMTGGVSGDAGMAGTAGSTGGAPNGSNCQQDADCASNSCYVISAMGQQVGLCGECKTDADCASTTGGGCTLPNPIGEMPTGATCNMGEAGGNCETDGVCADGLVCGDVVTISQLNKTIRSCGECSATTACDGEKICSPDFDLHTFAGTNNCVDPGSVANGAGCPFVAGMGNQPGTGNDAVCSGGHCTELKGAAFGQSIPLGIGVCGDCASNMDCDMNQMCTPAEAQVTSFMPIVIGDVTGSTCN